MQAPPGSRAGAEAPRGTHACRQCREPVTIVGDLQWGKAVHTATGQETGSGGHVAAPVDADLVRAAIAREAGGRQ